jgi:hypothetical protein
MHCELLDAIANEVSENATRIVRVYKEKEQENQVQK